MKKISIFLIIILSLTFVSCASMFSDSNYNVKVQSMPSNAKFVVYDLNTGMIVGQGQTPSMVYLAASNGYFSGAKYKFVFEKEGYDDTIVVITAGLDGWYWGNLLIGGILGMLIVDPATGAMYNLPEYVIVNLRKTQASNDELKVVDINTIPEEIRKDLVKIT